MLTRASLQLLKSSTLTTRSFSASHRLMTSQQPDSVILGLSPKGEALSSFEGASNLSERFSLARGDASKAGQLRVLHPTTQNEVPIAAVSVGAQKPAPKTAPDALPAANVYLKQELDERVRRATAKAARALLALPPVSTDAASKAEDKKTSAGPAPRVIGVDTFNGNAHAAAVGAGLGVWTVNHFRTRGADPVSHAFGADPSVQGGKHVTLVPIGEQKDAAQLDGAKPELGWETGSVYAEAQNWARELMETPANLMTPSIFCGRVEEKLGKLAKVSVEAHDEAWAKEKGMGCFLSVAAGTEEPAKLLEVHYKGGADGAPTLAFVGKGITFDTGGISLKPGLGMKLMKADMGGAATCVAATYAIAKLGLPINVVTVTPLTENMPSGKATKPGDCVTAMNGLTVEVDNTDAEGRLVLSDSLTYVTRTFEPHTLIDVATLTGAVLHALGHEYSAAFVEDESLWQDIKSAGEGEGDQFWRLPLSEAFMPYITNSVTDLVNVGRPAGSATAAIFLKQFVEGLEDRSKYTSDADESNATVRWAHLDIAGTMERLHPVDYQPSLLTGRPTRSLIEFARRFGASASK